MKGSSNTYTSISSQVLKGLYKGMQQLIKDRQRWFCVHLVSRFLLYLSYPSVNPDILYVKLKLNP